MEANRLSSLGWAQDQMKVACVKAINDGTFWSESEGGDLAFVLPLAGECPLIQFEAGRRFVNLRFVLIEATRRSKVFSSVIADVSLLGLDVTGIGRGFGAGCGNLCGTLPQGSAR